MRLMEKAILILGMVLVLCAGGGGIAAHLQGRVLREMAPDDCLVMEQHLRREGSRVRVEGGRLLIEGSTLLAEMDCRTESGQISFTWRYPLGDVDSRPALEE